MTATFGLYLLLLLAKLTPLSEPMKQLHGMLVALVRTQISDYGMGGISLDIELGKEEQHECHSHELGLASRSVFEKGDSTVCGAKRTSVTRCRGFALVVLHCRDTRLNWQIVLATKSKIAYLTMRLSITPDLPI